MAAPISTYGVSLEYGETSALGTTVAIKDFPAVMASRSSIETTTLADDAQTFIDGIRQTPESFDFKANWDKDVFAEINALSSVQYCKLSFPDGSNFTWQGKVSASNSEGGVDEVLEMTISITPTTVVTFAAS